MVDEAEAKWLAITASLSNSKSNFSNQIPSSTSNSNPLVIPVPVPDPDPGSVPAQAKHFRTKNVNEIENSDENSNHNDSTKIKHQKRPPVKSQSLQNVNPSRSKSRIKALESTLLKMNNVIENQKEIIERQRDALLNLNHKLAASTTESLEGDYFSESDADVEEIISSSSPEIEIQNHTKSLTEKQRYPATTKKQEPEAIQSQTHKKSNHNLTATQSQNQNKPNSKLLTKQKLTIKNVARSSLQVQLVEISARLEYLEDKIEKLDTDLPKKIRDILNKNNNLDQNTNNSGSSWKCQCQCQCQFGNVPKKAVGRFNRDVNCKSNYCSSFELAERKLSNVESAVDNFKEFLLRFLVCKRM